MTHSWGKDLDTVLPLKGEDNGVPFYASLSSSATISYEDGRHKILPLLFVRVDDHDDADVTTGISTSGHISCSKASTQKKKKKERTPSKGTQPILFHAVCHSGGDTRLWVLCRHDGFAIPAQDAVDGEPLGEDVRLELQRLRPATPGAQELWTARFVQGRSGAAAVLLLLLTLLLLLLLDQGRSSQT
ncbi:hypothetical protein HPB48_007221 [Haemaphysalis longicornis]|uniref:Uncharacterized protein n=1 Tax=Haemaphysalis longicornis TaxID=44386 RepID=A0A9J6GKN5_HAELO|nr:hypothetical protein HPB48_007221 [Haemaphysalis longicornis]